jgi:hypothetical protein
MSIKHNPYIENPLDADLDSMLSQLWKKKPYPTEKYLNLRAKLLIVQELRNLIMALKK